MDEPFGALDPITRAELHREFGRIQRQVRKTIVLVTHDMREAFTLADRIGVLDAGVLVECGPQVDARGVDASDGEDARRVSLQLSRGVAVPFLVAPRV